MNGDFIGDKHPVTQYDRSGMTKTEALRETIAEALRENYFKSCENMVDWEDCPAFTKDCWRFMADVALRACKEAGLVFGFRFQVQNGRKGIEREEIEL